MGKVTEVVIDTNLFVSAFGWDGKPEAVIQLLENGFIVNFISPEIFEEIKRVVAYPKLKFSASLQTKILEFVFSHSRLINPEKKVSLIEDDPDDNKFIECAMTANASFIISGDPHLLRLEKVENIIIANPTQFLKTLEIGDK